MAYTFQPDDLVLLKLQPYRQNTVKKRTSEKLAKRFFSPFKIIKHVGEMAYLLDLPSSLWIHPVVHVSLLRPYFGTEPTTDFRPLPFEKLIEFMSSDVDALLHTNLPPVTSSQQGYKINTNISHDLQHNMINTVKGVFILTSLLDCEMTHPMIQREDLGNWWIHGNSKILEKNGRSKELFSDTSVSHTPVKERNGDSRILEKNERREELIFDSIVSNLSANVLPFSDTSSLHMWSIETCKSFLGSNNLLPRVPRVFPRQ